MGAGLRALVRNAMGWISVYSAVATVANEWEPYHVPRRINASCRFVRTRAHLLCHDIYLPLLHDCSLREVSTVRAKLPRMSRMK